MSSMVPDSWSLQAKGWSISALQAFQGLLQCSTVQVLGAAVGPSSRTWRELQREETEAMQQVNEEVNRLAAFRPQPQHSLT